MCNYCDTSDDDWDLENGVLMPPVPREKRGLVLSVRFNADESDRLHELCPGSEKLSTWAKSRILGSDTPTISLGSHTEASSRFKVTDDDGNILFEVK